jgi:peptidoglycan hydrolase-like protein with peptidoglycan-binding domain
MLSISKPVGKGAFGMNDADIRAVQIALGAIRDKSYKVYYKGRVDGRCGPKTIDAICMFQMVEKINPMTGNIRPGDRTNNRLKAKTPPSVKNKIIQKVGGSTMTKQQIINANRKVADVVVKSWPLPKAEAESMAKCINEMASSALVPIKTWNKETAKIDNDGRFIIKFDILDYGPDKSAGGLPIRSAMIRKACAIVAKSPQWQQGFHDMMQFKSSKAYPLLKGQNKKPSADFLKSLEITMPNDLVICACLAQIEQKSDKESIMITKADYKLVAEVAHGVDPAVERAMKKLMNQPVRMHLIYLIAIDPLSRDDEGEWAITGHVFVGGIAPDGSTRWANGFYPGTNDKTYQKLKHTFDVEKQTGKVDDDGKYLDRALNSDPDYAYMAFKVTGSQYMQVQSFIHSFASGNDYGLLKNNCVHAAFGALMAGGLNMSSLTGVAYTPTDVFGRLRIHSGRTVN